MSSRAPIVLLFDEFEIDERFGGQHPGHGSDLAVEQVEQVAVVFADDFDDDVEAVLKTLPGVGPLFPRLRKMNSGHRATEFTRICRRVGIEGVTLHSYRYAWAERAKQCGYPERFAQEALGHNSKAVHRAYSRKAKVRLPSLASYEKQMAETHVIPFPQTPIPTVPSSPRPALQKA